MASRRVRLRYWFVDARQFMFWIAVAFVAGAGPNLAELAHPVALVGLTTVAGSVALVFWYRDRRKKGIGVYIHFTQKTRGPDQAIILASVRSWMAKHHRDWFRAGPDMPHLQTDKRIEGMLASIRHRLGEVELGPGATPPLFLYVQCGLREAFALGEHMAYIWGFRQIASPDQEPEAWTLPLVDWHIRTMSHHSPGKPYSLDLAKSMAPPDGRDCSVQAEPGTLSPQPVTSGLGQNPSRLAVLVYAASDGPDHAESRAFIAAAEAAASGSTIDGYLVELDDKCDRSLIIRVPLDPFLQALGDESGVSAAKIVSAIRERWHLFARQSYGTASVPVRLFLMGPAILAFALAAVFPPGSRLVPWIGFAQAGRVGGPTIPDLVAIVDGDDVGAGMEGRLLGRSLIEAVQYSKSMELAMKAVADRVTAIPGVALLSTAGDSAIFTVPSKSIESFEQTLEAARGDLDFRFSCGYGQDSREAFVALRAAKTGGKNVTIGAL